MNRRDLFKGAAAGVAAAVVAKDALAGAGPDADIPILARQGKPVECWVTACPFPIGRAGPFGWEVTPEARAAGFTLDDVLNSR